MATVTLVGGSPLWQRGIASLLEEGGHHVVTVEGLESWVPGHDGSCVVVNVTPDRDLVPVTSFRELHPHVPVVVVLDEVEAAGVAAAMRAGGSAVTGESELPATVLSVITAAIDDLVVLPAGVAQSMALMVPESTETSAWLSDEEAEWLRSMAAGQTVADIAEQVGYSERAMFRQLKTLYLRLGVRNRTEALLWAGRHGILGTND